MIGLTRLLCRRGLSVGADGMIFIEPSERYDFKWRFFNADGSEAEMCGNGGRCAARFAQRIGMAGTEMTFETIAGPIQARVEGRVVKLQLPVPRDIRMDQEIALGEDDHRSILSTPGSLIPSSGWRRWKVDISELGPQIRFHPHFQPAGTNVNFVRREGPPFPCAPTSGGWKPRPWPAAPERWPRPPSPIEKYPISRAVRTRGGEILVVHLEGQAGADGSGRVSGREWYSGIPGRGFPEVLE